MSLAAAQRATARGKRRVAVVVGVATIVVLVGVLLSLMVGEYGLSPLESLRALLGDGNRLGVYFVQEIRLPRALGAVLVGAALGLSGALFQIISGNPLGSPDIVGFTTGSATGALMAIIVFGASPSATAGGAVLGGVLAAALIAFFAGGLGTNGMRLVLIGIGISAALKAINTLLLVKAPLTAAQAAEQWNAGSLYGVGFRQLAWLAPAVLVTIPVLMWLSTPLSMLPLGEDLAVGIGVRATRVRAVAVVTAVVLVALATAVAGPVAFVALAAPHLAKRLTRGAGANLGTSALVGAALVVVSDLVAQRLFAPRELAVGVITGSLGGIYLVILLALRFNRRRV
ncbi:MAG: FecCD family ABC transporter permease [Galactobacter sp.]